MHVLHGIASFRHYTQISIYTSQMENNVTVLDLNPALHTFLNSEIEHLGDVFLRTDARPSDRRSFGQKICEQKEM
jgi:hypothetical protein